MRSFFGGLPRRLCEQRVKRQSKAGLAGLAGPEVQSNQQVLGSSGAAEFALELEVPLP